MNISDEFLDDVRALAQLDYNEKAVQFYLLRDRYRGDGTHPDVVKAKEFLDRARRLRCEVDPEFAAEQLEQVDA